MRHARDFFAPLAIGAPEPLREIPVEPTRMIHFFDPSKEKIVGKLPEIARKADVVLGILETAQGVNHVEEIAAASPRMQGMSFGPADLAASRRMKTTRVGGGHPGYVSMSDPDLDGEGQIVAGGRVTAQQDPWHYSIARM